MITKAVRKAGLRIGLYHSLFEWFNPLYLKDKANGGSTQVYVENILMPQLHDIVNSYQPDILWSDGDWEMPDSYWNSTEFLAWLYNDSPVKDKVVVNDRWGSGDSCKHGGYYTCSDRYNPGVLQNHKWENCLTIDSNSWGYNRNTDIEEYLTIQDLLFELVSTVACGGNVLINVGPSHDGKITPIFQERFLQLGQWLQTNGISIYESTPWRSQNDSAVSVWYTLGSDENVYATALAWPTNNLLILTQPIPKAGTKVQLLGYGPVTWKNYGNSIAITMPISYQAAEPAWTFQLINVQ